MLLPHFQKGKLRLAFQLPRPGSLRSSPCLSADTRILAPRFSSSSTITPRLHRPPAGLRPVLVWVGAPAAPCARGTAAAHVRPPADAVTAGPVGAERAWSGGGLRAALPLAAGLGSGAGRAPGRSVIGRAADGGGSQRSRPRGAEVQALAWLRLRGATSLAPSSAGGLRVLTAASAAQGEGRS